MGNTHIKQDGSSLGERPGGEPRISGPGLEQPNPGTDGRFEALATNVAAPKPIAGFLQQGEHTPGFCLDRVDIEADPIKRTAPGIKIFGADGATQAGALIWKGIREVRSREDLTGGFMVEHTPQRFAANYEMMTAPDFAGLGFSPRTNTPEASDVLKVRELVKWLIPEGCGPYLQSLRDANELLLRKGIDPEGCLYLIEHGVKLVDDGPKKLAVPINGDSLPHGFTSGMFNGPFLSFSRSFQESRLADRAIADLRGLTPQEIAAKLFDPDAVRDILPIIAALHATARDLAPAFHQAFKDGHHEFKVGTAGETADARVGTISVNGVIKLASDELLVFTASDAPVMVVTDGKISFYEQLGSQNVTRWGAKVRVIDELRSESEECRELRYVRLSPDVAKRSLIVAMSDGMVPHKSQDKALLLANCGEHCGSAEELRDFLVRFSSERWEHWQKEMQGRFEGVDDRFCVVAEGAAYY